MVVVAAVFGILVILFGLGLIFATDKRDNHSKSNLPALTMIAEEVIEVRRTRTVKATRVS